MQKLERAQNKALRMVTWRYNSTSAEALLMSIAAEEADILPRSPQKCTQIQLNIILGTEVWRAQEKPNSSAGRCDPACKKVQNYCIKFYDFTTI